MTDNYDFEKWIELRADGLAKDLVEAIEAGGGDLEAVIESLGEKMGELRPRLEFEVEDAKGLREFEDGSEGFIDITNKTQMALREAGEPGIADALLSVRVNPVGPESGTHAIAVACKRWFTFEGLSESEHEVLHRAMMLAARAEGVDWAS